MKIHFSYVIRIAVVILDCIILISAYYTGLSLSAAGVSSPDAPEILMKYYKVSSIAAFCMLVPLVFLFDSLLKRKKPCDTAKTIEKSQ